MEHSSKVVADINEVGALINNMVVPKSMQHVGRMADPKWKQLWLDAAYKEMDGLFYETKMFDIVKDIPDGDKHHTVLSYLRRSPMRKLSNGRASMGENPRSNSERGY